MFVFGHMGIGSQLVRPLRKGLPFRWLLLGTLLPDIIDKPTYYVLKLLTGKQGAELGLFSGTRLFGHTALFLLLLSAVAFARKSKILAAVALGIATHFALDLMGDYSLSSDRPDWTNGGIVAVLFPFLGFRFPVTPFETVSEHLGTFLSPFFLWTEALGALLLSWEWWKSAYREEVLAAIRERRLRRKLAKRRRRFARAERR